MKTRIISSAIGLALFGAVLIFWNRVPIVLDICISIINLIATWEILDGTKLVKNRVIMVISSIFALLVPFIYNGYIPISATVAIVIFAVALLITSMVMNKTINISQLTSAFSLTLFITYAFSTLLMLTRTSNGQGLFYFLLAFSFAWVSDGGAYFVGVLFGKHQLAPIISPKKTIEGAIGGVVCSTLVTFIMCLFYNSLSTSFHANIVAFTLLAPIFAVSGIFGDLIASYIKRSCNIKDYGNLIPGHGGILDRFDSILFISPLLYMLISYFPMISAI
ncbi:MAG: CDP-archaeol synthase [Oscillospiraceae bacterium]|nr:CDP-archaeol synthase [Oscillospiraceae bacterium]